MALSTASSVQNFAPVQSVSVSAGAASQSATFTYAVPTVVSQVDGASVINSCLVTNAGTKTAFFKFGGASVAATTSDTPILAGAIMVIDKGTNMTCATICADADTTTVYFTAGTGS